MYNLPRHHCIPKHEWLERFGNLKGVNAKDNICNLTVAQHSEVHLLLYELNHNEYDLIAHQACAGILLKRKTQQEKKLNPPKRKKKHLRRKNSWHI